MIHNCPHEPKAFVGGSHLTVCKACRQANMDEFYKGGTDYVSYDPPPASYVYHLYPSHCEFCAGLDDPDGF